MEDRSFTQSEVYASTEVYQEYCEYMHSVHLCISKLPTAFLANIIVNAVFLIVTILGNSIVLYAILKTPSLHSPSVVLLAGLASSDLGVGLVVQPLYLLMRILDLQGYFHCTLATLFDVTSYFVCSMSFLIVSAVSVDRFLALYLHLRYPIVVTTKRVLRCLLILCVISLVVCTSKLWSMHAFVVLVVIFILGCLTTSSFAYFKIYRIVCYHKESIKSSAQPVVENGETQLEHRRNAGGERRRKSILMARHKRSAISMFYVYCLMLLCYFPYLCCRAILGTTGLSPTKEAVFEATVTVVYMNSLLNPLMYCWRLHDVRTAIIQTLLERGRGRDRTLPVSLDRVDRPKNRSEIRPRLENLTTSL